MADVTSLTLAVDTTQVRRASADLDTFAKRGKVTETAVGSVAGKFRTLATAAQGLTSALAARAILQAADTYTTLNARLQLATRSSTEFARAQREVFAIAQRTGTGLAETADLYGSLSRSTESLGVSQEQVLRVTEAINQAMVVSGTSAQGASAALVQLGQAFSSGVLRGEELNSILEQSPRLARAIADGLGVPIGALRKLGEEGKLTADKVFGALQNAAPKIAQEFERIPLTFGRAITLASNAVLKLIGTLDQATGASSGLAGAIANAAQWASKLADEIKLAGQGDTSVGVLAQAFQYVSETVQVVYANVKFVLVSIGREIGAIAAQLAALARLDINGFKAISEAVKEDGKLARAELDALEKRILVIGRLRLPDLGQSDSKELARRGRPAQPFGTPVPELPATTKTGVDKAKNYLESLQKQLQATKDLTVAETLLDDIRSGRLGKVSQRQREELLAVAKQIDAAKALKDAKEAEAKAREGAAEISKRAMDAAVSEAQSLIDSNAQLRDEIELIGKSEAQKQAIVYARQANAIAAKEEELAMMQSAGAAEAEIQVIEQQIILMRQRQELMNKHFDETAKASVEATKELDEFQKNAARSIQGVISDSMVDIINGRFDNIGQNFSRVLQRMAAEAIAADLTRKIFGATAGGTGQGWIGLLANLVGSFGGGGNAAIGYTGANGPNNPSAYIGSASMPATAQSAAPMRAMSTSVNYAPTIQIDSRTDRAEVATLVRKQIAAGNAQLIEQINRGQR